MIKINNLSKIYRSTKALNNINIEINNKSIIGLVGNNGAGKTTLINQIMGYSRPSSGEVRVMGFNPVNNHEVAKNIVLIDEKADYDMVLNLQQIITKQKAINPEFNVERCNYVLDQFDLSLKKRYLMLSKGMKNQFNIALGLGADKEITVMDEPTSGLDENARDTFYKILINLYCNTPKLMIISTHLFAEIQKITTSVIVMRKGEIIAYDDVENIEKLLVIVKGDRNEVIHALAGREILREESMLNVTEAVTHNVFKRDEIRELEHKKIELIPMQANEVCRVLCNYKGAYNGK